MEEKALNPTTSPLYEFTRDHVIPKGIAKLFVTVGEYPQTSTIITNFLMVNCSSVINGIIGRLHLKTLKAVTSIYHLIKKFPAAEGIGEVRGCQYDSREYYNKSLKMTEKDSKLKRIRVGMIATETLKDLM